MLNKESITKSSLPKVRQDYIVVAPHQLLRPYIANYTFTNPSTMSDQQTILPTISTTLVCTFQDGQFTAGLRGVNTRPTMIANYARQFDFMFLVEFHAAGLFPFLQIDQHQLTDDGFLVDELDQILHQQIAEAYYTAADIPSLTEKLDRIFLARRNPLAINPTFSLAFEKIIECNGNIRMKDLANATYYSEKHLNRLFMKYAGAKMKTCSRIIRLKNAADLLNAHQPVSLLFEQTGHHDYAHFIRDFKNIYGITPKEYLEKMSIFYNDPYKL
ncbi:helix-turn-helix domain-containing protein [Enterococcus hulanensis]|uniref:Helix-turn-helix domain-containing protein n=1 Tax=Enterococcus hulanensis TaxID=2559929 RepID=A0ABU3EWF7_9ENTE|nr:helix-turn-helix domain-containing protein [Enterococcus hulanensis]MDT2599197.1 helix-turn-helix domain-containing protein [Enterococcus hulanensis]MDT2608604.1 helix-turn-helix domain-containing protein [Enterococcus hulanensis]MDT2616359.1 helix-turn-helix domain-containing protein [Enterococcus hulanensis]MDT2627601.1 helix-turn-helix domain-containing protein [Enterococcus hulanensis]MDT2655631.1 helix-turn-helix domain-containing protein [Enterococcus hulanensis]